MNLPEHLVVLTAIAPVSYAVAWAIAQRRNTEVVRAIADRAIKGCPPERRAEVLRALSGFAAQLRIRPPGVLGGILDRSGPRNANGDASPPNT
jgi:hypothetical protein